MMRWPVARPPVNDTRSTRGSSISGAPAFAPAPSTRLADAGGQARLVEQPHQRIAVCGVSSLGLRTKVLPAARQGATFQEACSSG